MPPIFLVDDDPSFSRSTARFLKASGYETCIFSSGDEFLQAVGPETRGILLLDLNMPGVNGLELQEMIIGAGIAMPIIFLTGQGDIPTTVHAMRRGAEDFLTKMASSEVLLSAVERALAREARERRGHERLGELRRRLATLTDREKEVMTYVIRGKMNKEIAAVLGINERTVKLHRTSITRKMQMQSVAELTRGAKELGLLDE
jgi:FixJ family two-component response regulator